MRVSPLLLLAPALCSSAIAQINFAPVPAADFGVIGVSSDMITFGHGACAADFDGDGDLDLVAPQNSGEQLLYFRNDGGTPMFVEATAGTGLGICSTPHGCRAADIDNDGDQDLMVVNEWAPFQLYINDGNAHFTEEAAARGVVQVSYSWDVTFGDYDRDGWLDFYVSNRGPDNTLYRNTGNGYFEDKTAFAGVAFPSATTFVSVFFDYNDDGWPDLLVPNEKGPHVEPNDIFRNNGDGTFTSVGVLLDARDAISAMGVDFVDVFNDGGWDYYCSDMPFDHLFCVWNPVAQTFDDETYSYGLECGPVGWACQFFDANNDGWQDLHVTHTTLPNYCFINPATPQGQPMQWLEVSSNNWGSVGEQTVTIVSDFDNDGRVDILDRLINQHPFWPHTFRFLKNVSEEKNWIRVQTVGSISNRDGIGAKVSVRTPGVTQRQQVRSGVGFQGGVDKRVHFGVDDATTVDIDVWWPSGATQCLHDVPVNQTLVVREPAFDLRWPARIGQSTVIDFACPDDAGMNYAIMLASLAGAGTPIGGRVFPVEIDALSAATLTPGNGVLAGNVAPLHQGTGGALLSLPPSPGLIGVEFFAAGLTFTSTLELGSFSPALSIVVQP